MPSGDNNPNQEEHIAVQTALSLGDLNRDGEPDFFLLPNRTAVRARLFVSSPGGYQVTPRSYEYGYYAKALDWNDDGRPDLLIKGGQANERNLKIFRIDHSPGIADPDSRLVQWQELTGNESFDYVDVDRDGKEDLVVVHHLALRRPSDELSGDERPGVGLFNVSFYVGTGSRSLEEPPFELRQRIYLPQFGNRRAIRWGAVMHETTRRGDHRRTRLYLTGAEGLAHRIGYLPFDPKRGRFETRFRPIERRPSLGITVRVAGRDALFSTLSGARAYNSRRFRHRRIFETTEGAVDLFALDAPSGRQVFGVVQRLVEQRIRLFERTGRGGAGRFREIASIETPPLPRYVSYFHSTRGVVKHHEPDRLVLAHRNGATVYELNLP